MAWSSVSVQCILGHDFTGALKPTGCRPNSPDVAEFTPAAKGKAAVAKAKAESVASASSLPAAKVSKGGDSILLKRLQVKKNVMHPSRTCGGSSRAL